MPKNIENTPNTISHADTIKRIRRGSIVCRCRAEMNVSSQ